MRNLAWSFLERIFPRAASALVMLVLAHFVPPGVVGVYAWAILGLTLVQSVTDGAIRQLAVVAVASPEGRAFLRNYILWSSVAGPLALLALLGGLVLGLPEGFRGDLAAVSPILVVPVIQAARVRSLAQLQIAGGWSMLARGQLLAASGSFAVSLPVLVITRSLLACALQLVLTELIFTALVRRWASAQTQSSPPLLTEVAPGWATREFVHVVLYSVAGWVQGQADRLLLGWLTSPTKLGLYSLSWSTARSAGDAVSFSTANVLRPQLLKTGSRRPTEVRSAASAVLQNAVWLSAGVVVLTGGGATLLLPHLLGEEWEPAITAVPIMALSILPTLLSWSFTVVLIAAARMKWAAPIKALGIALSLPIALAAATDFELAAWLLVARETTVLACMALATGRYCPVRPLITGVLLLVILSSGTILLVR